MELTSITHTVINSGLVNTVTNGKDTCSHSADGKKSQSGVEDTVTLSRQDKAKATYSSLQMKLVAYEKMAAN